MTTQYDGKTYNANATGQCGLNYKDGDCFSFAFFLSDEPNEDPIEDAGAVELTITDLYKNIWSKKKGAKQIGHVSRKEFTTRKPLFVY